MELKLDRRFFHFIILIKQDSVGQKSIINNTVGIFWSFQGLIKIIGFKGFGVIIDPSIYQCVIEFKLT